MTTQVCPSCFEEIDGRASKCPKCTAYVSPITRTVRNPLFLIAFFFAFMALSYIPMLNMMPEDIQDPMQVVEILDSRIVVGESTCKDGGLRVDVIGKLRNSHETALKRMTFTIEIFDSEGNTVEFITDQDYDFIVTGSSESSFKIGGAITADPSNFATHVVKIVKAESGGPF